MSDDPKHGSLDDYLGPGYDPEDEEVTPGPKIEETEFRPGERDGAPHEAQVRFGDELDDSLTIDPEVWIPSPEDGLPEAVDGKDPMQGIAPPLTYETLVCMQDDRQYVEVFRHEAALARSNVFSCRRPYDESGESTQPRRVFPKERVTQRFGKPCVEEGGVFVLVRPIREECKHYVRMMLNNDSEPDRRKPHHYIMFRNCAARRSIGGGLMKLSDEAVYACTLREPRDPRSEDKWINEPDRIRLETRPHETLIESPFRGTSEEDETK